MPPRRIDLGALHGVAHQMQLRIGLAKLFIGSKQMADAFALADLTDEQDGKRFTGLFGCSARRKATRVCAIRHDPQLVSRHTAADKRIAHKVGADQDDIGQRDLGVE